MQSSVGKNQGRVGRPVREMIIIVAIRITLVILMIMVIIVAIKMIKKAGIKICLGRPKRPARPRLDRQARIQFWGVLNVSLYAYGAQLFDDPKTFRDQQGDPTDLLWSKNITSLTQGPN